MTSARCKLKARKDSFSIHSLLFVLYYKSFSQDQVLFPLVSKKTEKQEKGSFIYFHFTEWKLRHTEWWTSPGKHSLWKRQKPDCRSPERIKRKAVFPTSFCSGQEKEFWKSKKHFRQIGHRYHRHTRKKLFLWLPLILHSGKKVKRLILFHMVTFSLLGSSWEMQKTSKEEKKN